MVDVQAQIDAVTRAMRTEQIDGARSYVQVIAQDYPVGIDEVWNATTTERIARWFLPVTGDLHVGGRYQLTGNAGGEVLSCAPPSGGTAGFRATWEFGGSISWITVRLTSLAPDRTRLELEHTSRVDDIPVEMWQTYGPGATGVGWDHGLLGLALHLGALEGQVSPAAAQEWSLSPEGTAFARAAADRWSDVHVAAGADREQAAHAADATFGFYTGHAPDA
ncbi:SRPBCC domain-containing protein [Microbacterium sp. Sa4CUA7]|uniref:SRPBCC domain-containing protein n=1 Tax=Microbacterium pullorum TaxID=2762236 RepID=A0ABR8S3S2_9MICO|nr:SRPBCC domain-containing protein [Microbacterium pullorum]MBD7958103.1 SRPBCC domain-containing protein [Microbacterium pullorum]